MINYFKNGIWTKHQKALLSLLLVAIILSSSLYLYCVSAIIMETANRDRNIQNLQIIQKEYQELERNYLSLLAKLNLDYAYSLGFISNEKSLSFLTKEIKVAQENSRILTR